MESKEKVENLKLCKLLEFINLSMNDENASKSILCIKDHLVNSYSDIYQKILDQFENKLKIIYIDVLLFTNHSKIISFIFQSFNSNQDDLEKLTLMEQYSLLNNLIGEKNCFKHILFIIDNFESFVQYSSLLYLLLDLTRNYYHVTFVAITKNLSVLERFEKRIKSRFSNNILILIPETLDDYKKKNLFIKQLTRNFPKIKKKIKKNDVLDDLVLSYFGKNSGYFNYFNSMLNLLEESKFIISNYDISGFKDNLIMKNKCPQELVLSSCSSLEILILVLISRYLHIYKTCSTMSTNKLLNEYSKFMNTYNYAPLFVSEETIRNGLDELVKMNLIRYEVTKDGYIMEVESYLIEEYLKNNEISETIKMCYHEKY